MAKSSNFCGASASVMTVANGLALFYNIGAKTQHSIFTIKQAPLLQV
jgi:hypothetical protein